MVGLILNFVSACRASGLRVSTAEFLDCLEQLDLVDISDEMQFKTVLSSNFAKSRRDRRRFEQLYRLFFHELSQIPASSSPESMGGLIAELVEVLSEGADGDVTYRAIIEFLSGNPLTFLAELKRIRTEERPATQGGRFNLGPLASRLQVLMNLNRARNTVAHFINANESRIGFDTGQDLALYFNTSLDTAYTLLMNEPRPPGDDTLAVTTYRQHYRRLGELPFSMLSQREVEEMREVIVELVRKLKDMATRRWASHSRGVLDVKKTLRRAQRYQGIPVEIVFRHHPRRKAKIIALCDVSSSVWSAARFMLNILYSLQECFTKVHTFIFVSGLAEVTDIFEAHDINLAIEKVLRETAIEYYAPTDYGETFRHFKRDFMDIPDKKTTLIIMGDARTNYFNPEDAILEELRERCRRVIWLNPEPETEWNTGDSEMLTYKPHCHEVRQCRNLNQLIDFIEELIL